MFSDKFKNRFRKSVKRLPYMVVGVAVAFLLCSLIGHSLALAALLIALTQVGVIAASRTGHFGVREAFDSAWIGVVVSYSGSFLALAAVGLLTIIGVHFLAGFFGFPEIKEQK